MQLTFSVLLPDELYRELMEACRECECSPKRFAAESIESVLASRRLPRVAEARMHGARMHEFREAELEP